MTGPFNGGGCAGAVLLTLVAEDDAAALVGALSPDEVQALGVAMESLSDLAEADIEAVLADFIERARATSPLADKGKSMVQSAIERSLGPSRARSILKGAEGMAQHPVYAEIQWLGADELVEFIDREHPQVSAVAVALIDPGVAALALDQLDDSVRADILLRVASLQPLSNDALDDLRTAIATSSAAPIVVPVEVGGTGQVATLLNRSGRSKANRTLKLLAKQDKALAAAIDAGRVTFEDLTDLTDKELGIVVRAVDARTLALALKGLDEATCDRFLAAMSVRAAQTVRDDILELASASRADVEAAQAAMVATARRLSDEDVIRIGGAADDA